jgi:hypothetical protein
LQNKQSVTVETVVSHALVSDHDDASLDAAIVNLARWAADSKTEAAADSRVRQTWAQRQAEDEATLASVLVGLAERKAMVAVHTVTGSTVRGAVAGLGVDYVAVVSSNQLALLPTAAIQWVRPEGPAPTAAFGDRAAPQGRLVGVLSNLAAEGTELRFVTGTESLVGELVGVGEDVLTVRPTGGHAGQVVYVPVASLSEASLRLSG